MSSGWLKADTMSNFKNETEKLRGHEARKHAVKTGLDDYAQRRKQREIARLFGTLDYDKSYDYKRERKRDSERNQT